MKAVVQRVSLACVRVEGTEKARIGQGLLVLLGVAAGDTSDDASWMAGKISRLRVFPDGRRHMNLSPADIRGELLLISQFTLLGDASRGNRPSFSEAAGPDLARQLYLEVAAGIRKAGLQVRTGEFGAMMEVELINDGPVTIILESPKKQAGKSSRP
ncbi:MAG: D-tyrosyl-tRNA(Tyr) deacylase [Thermoleophilia bacterium]|nr:D-tyrosyl-tRNA(Tyr) deacylase [Thermoleophilia bacterium]